MSSWPRRASSARFRSRLTAPIDFPEAMVFRPTLEEMADFPKLIDTIERAGAHLAGICKIVPPEDWEPRKVGYGSETFDFMIETPLKQIFTPMSDKGAFQTKCLTQKAMTVEEYRQLAESSSHATPYHTSYEDLERKFWKSLHFVPPTYGADVTMSITDDDEKYFNVAKLDSILKHIKEETGKTFYGVNSPYIYFGMWKATFSWHVEDMDLYGINFLHYGKPKTWYCVPPKYGHLLERAARQLFPNVAAWCSNFMRHKTCLISPSLLDDLGVPYQRVVQETRDIIIVFPYAYHAGFNHGYNIAESTNFASKRWIEYGKRHRPCDCSRNKVHIDMSIFVKRFQPELYEDWLMGKDIKHHPEDPPDVVREIAMKARDPVGYANMMKERLKQREMEANKHLMPIFTTTKGKEFHYDIEERRLINFKLISPKVVVLENEEDKEKFKEWEADLNREKDNNDSIVLDVYRHAELNHLKVSVFRDGSGRCTNLAKVKDILGLPALTSMTPLIENGDFIKIGQRCKKRKVEDKNKIRYGKKDPNEERPMMCAGLYVHVTRREYTAMVDPFTMELIGQPTEEVRQFLEGNDFSIAELIECGVFQKIDDVYIPLPEELEEVKEDESKEAEKQGTTSSGDENSEQTNKIENMDISQNGENGTPENVGAKGSENGEGERILDVYTFKNSSNSLVYDPEKKSVLGRDEGCNVEEMVTNGELVKIGEQRSSKPDHATESNVLGGTDDNSTSTNGRTKANDRVYKKDIRKQLDPHPMDKSVFDEMTFHTGFTSDESDDDPVEMGYEEEEDEGTLERWLDDDDDDDDDDDEDDWWRFGGKRSFKKKKRKIMTAKQKAERDRKLEKQRIQLEFIRNQINVLIQQMREKQQQENKVEVAIDESQVDGRKSIVTKELFGKCIAVWKNVGIVFYEDGKLFWRGVQFDIVSSFLRLLLDGDTEREEESEDKISWSNLANDILKLYIAAEPGYVFSVSKVYESLFPYEPVKDATRNHKSNIVQVLEILEGVNLLRKPKTGHRISRFKSPNCALVKNPLKRGKAVSIEYHYVGPNVFQPWMEKVTENHGDVLRGCSVRLTVEDRKAVKLDNMKHFHGSSGVVKNKLVPKGGEDVICKCGFTELREMRENDGKITVKRIRMGNKRRRRCGKCAGCKTPNCNECVHCLRPSNKQACVMRTCLNPIQPGCECFK